VSGTQTTVTWTTPFTFTTPRHTPITLQALASQLTYDDATFVFSHWVIERTGPGSGEVLGDGPTVQFAASTDEISVWAWYYPAGQSTNY
jgi:hypothetical protein